MLLRQHRAPPALHVDLPAHARALLDRRLVQPLVHGQVALLVLVLPLPPPVLLHLRRHAQYRPRARHRILHAPQHARHQARQAARHLPQRARLHLVPVRRAVQRVRRAPHPAPDAVRLAALAHQPPRVGAQRRQRAVVQLAQAIVQLQHHPVQLRVQRLAAALPAARLCRVGRLGRRRAALLQHRVVRDVLLPAARVLALARQHACVRRRRARRRRVPQPQQRRHPVLELRQLVAHLHRSQHQRTVVVAYLAELAHQPVHTPPQPVQLLPQLLQEGHQLRQALLHVLDLVHQGLRTPLGKVQLVKVAQLAQLVQRAVNALVRVAKGAHRGCHHLPKLRQPLLHPRHHALRAVVQLQ
mmetsp:Transcript_93/g.281  ORF Transcript_93/g.281 Transcript_93/m.281 type:complete len:356 (+) Transcript_93:583-1650(+)